jgi:ketosteroid isomerase-like protein
MGDDQSREFEEFRTQCRAAVGQQVNGHTEPFQALWSHADDVVLMGAAGAHAIGWQDVSASLRWASEHLDFTDWHAENLLTKINDDFALTCDLEHMRHEVNGEVQQRTLRVSQGYRYEEGQWRIMFRHGDPMAERITPPEVTRS